MSISLKMGSQWFDNVDVPLLWGTRAVIQDSEGRISIIDLGQGLAALEVLGDKPAPGTVYRPIVDGFLVLKEGAPVYSYSPSQKRISSASPSLKLMDCEIGPSEMRIGSNVFSGNVVVGAGVGFHVTEQGIAMGAPLPPTLAKLVVREPSS